MKHSTISIYGYFLVCSCITPFELNTPFQEELVVEGMITDQPGPYLVKVSKTIPVNSQLEESNWVSRASVVIEDDQGNSETLVEKSQGNYFTTSLQGVIGRSYSITISLDDGNTYKSVPETLLPVGDFKLSKEFVQNEPANANRQIHSENGFNIYLDSEVSNGQERRVWWNWTGTFEILTYPQFITKKVATRTGRYITLPNPPTCSHYAMRLIDSVLVGPFRECTCCTCWVTERSDAPLISDTKFVNADSIKKMKIDFVETNVRTLYNKYYLEVEQLSLSKAVYDFWRIVKIQKGNSSNLFQTPPPKTTGNISATSTHALPVIGYFAASSIKKHSLVIERSDVPYPLGQIDTLVVQCTQAYKNSTTTRPSFW